MPWLGREFLVTADNKHNEGVELGMTWFVHESYTSDRAFQLTDVYVLRSCVYGGDYSVGDVSTGYNRRAPSMLLQHRRCITCCGISSLFC